MPGNAQLFRGKLSMCDPWRSVRQTRRRGEIDRFPFEFLQCTPASTSQGVFRPARLEILNKAFVGACADLGVIEKTPHSRAAGKVLSQLVTRAIRKLSARPWSRP